MSSLYPAPVPPGYMSNASVLFGDTVRDIVQAEREKRQATDARCDYDGAATYAAVLMQALCEVAPDHPALRRDVRRAYIVHGEQCSRNLMGRFNGWDYASGELAQYDPPEKVAATLDQRAQARREEIMKQLQPTVQLRRRRRWFFLWAFGPRQTNWLDVWRPARELQAVAAWRLALIDRLRSEYGRPGPACETLLEFARQTPYCPPA